MSRPWEARAQATVSVTEEQWDTSRTRSVRMLAMALAASSCAPPNDPRQLAAMGDQGKSCALF